MSEYATEQPGVFRSECEFCDTKTIVTATTSGYNACRTCARMHDLTPADPWTGKALTELLVK